MNRQDILLQNVQYAQQKLRQASLQAGQNETVRFMAVTKYAKDEDVLFLLERGLIHHIGESRVQQAEKRWKNPAFAKYNTVKHFIGHLQKNKAAKAALLFDFIDSLDDLDTALLVNEKARQAGRFLKGLVQIKLTDRESQSGLDMQAARNLARELKNLPHLHICGYMAIAPQTDDSRITRPLFHMAAEAFETDFPAGTERYLSLGMSGDFETAVEEGSTLPRLGSIIFARNLEEA